VVPGLGQAYERELAMSTLALDLGGTDAALPDRAAALGVPCIGLAARPMQARLWPALGLRRPVTARAAALGRWMLTDQGDAARLCEQARQRLDSAPVGAAPVTASDVATVGPSTRPRAVARAGAGR
jgi:hypothetical protein